MWLAMAAGGTVVVLAVRDWIACATLLRIVTTPLQAVSCDCDKALDLGLGDELLGHVTRARNAYRDFDHAHRLYRGDLQRVGATMATTLLRTTLLALATILAIGICIARPPAM